MTPGQSKQIEQLNKMHEKLSNASYDYWSTYSNAHSWQFWFLLIMLILPLFALYVFIDRRKAILIGFFGLNVHVWLHYLDVWGVTQGLWHYPYKLVPFMSASFAADSSLFPVCFMLLYQWTLNHNRNYYLYAFGLCVFLSFIFKPALSTYGLFQLFKGTSYIYLFVAYVIIMLLSKWIANIFLHFQKEPKPLWERSIHLGKLFTDREKAK